MLNWIFGSDKEKKKDEKKEEKPSKDYELAEEEKWVYDYLRQYLTSPIWRNPIVDFFEEYCVVFEDNEQNKFEYTKIYQEFTGLVAMLIESVVEETGIGEKTLQKCIFRGMRSERDRKIFQQILLCDNFLAFKKIMITKNKQLQIEALQKLQFEEPKFSQSLEIGAKELERLEIEKAIAISKAMDEKALAQQQKEMEEALRQSSISAKHEEEKRSEENKKQDPKEEEVKKSALGQLPPLVIGTKKDYKPIEDYEKDQEGIRKQIAQLKSKNVEEKEGAEDRKKRLLEQRELIRKKKQQERQTELNNFVQNVYNSQTQKQTGDKIDNKVSEEELQRRRNLMKKFKEQLKD